MLSSQPVAVRAEEHGVAIDRVRQAVSPHGELSEELVTVVLDHLTAAGLEKRYDVGILPADNGATLTGERDARPAAGRGGGAPRADGRRDATGRLHL